MTPQQWPRVRADDHDVGLIFFQRPHRQHPASRRAGEGARRLSGKLLAGKEGFGRFGEYGHLLWWSLILGAGLGGNFTPIGSASTVVAIAILKREGYKITFMQYVKIGALVVLVQLTLASTCLFAADKAGIIPKVPKERPAKAENGH